VPGSPPSTATTDLRGKCPTCPTHPQPKPGQRAGDTNTRGIAMTTCPDPNKKGNPYMSAPLSPDAMTYLANVRRVLDRHPDFLPSAPAIPATQSSG